MAVEFRERDSRQLDVAAAVEPFSCQIHASLLKAVPYHCLDVLLVALAQQLQYVVVVVDVELPLCAAPLLSTLTLTPSCFRLCALEPIGDAIHGILT